MLQAIQIHSQACYFFLDCIYHLKRKFYREGGIIPHLKEKNGKFCSFLLSMYFEDLKNKASYMNIFNKSKSLPRVSLFFLLCLLLLGNKPAKENKPDDCIETKSCVLTYVSEQAIVFAHKLNQEVIYSNGPIPLDQIILLTDKNGNFIEVEVAKNVSFYKALWKGNEILISRFDLDTSKSLRALSNSAVHLTKDPNPNSPIISTIPENTLLDVLENTKPLSQRRGYVKVKFDETIGWAKRDLLSNDKYDIRFFKKRMADIAKPYMYTAEDSKFNITLKIIGDGFKVSNCKISTFECTAEPRMDRSSFGVDQEAVFFKVNASNEQFFDCEIRREDLLDEWERLDSESITAEELNPFMTCDLKNRETESQMESEEE